MTDQNDLQDSLMIITSAAPKLRDGDDQTRKLIDKSVPLDKLQQNYVRFLATLEKLFKDTQQGRVGDFVLDEISFSAEISASGDFKLIGTGVGVEAKSGITFVLRRDKDHHSNQVSGTKKE